MKKTAIIILLCISFFCIACEDKQQAEKLSTKVPLGQVASITQTNSKNIHSTKLLRLDRDPLSVAHREYLSAYNTYVMLLRESGPQTMATLEALADYQKKYQIYRMMMKDRGHK